MKKFLFIFAGSLISLLADAKEVSVREAANVAKLYLTSIADNNFTSEIKEVKAVEKDGVLCYYIVKLSPEGWALVAADDRTTPIIGYSLTGIYYDDQPDAMVWFMNEYTESMKFVLQRKQFRHSEWDMPQVITRAATNKIEPLIKVNWNQGAPYNKHCPVNTKNQRALVGCVAVAFAQALSVYQKPESPKGRNGYTDNDFGLVNVNFDREAPYNWDAIMVGSDNYSETARLLFHCGVAVNMDYGLTASGSYTQRIAKALTSFFSYDEAVRYYTRNNYTGDWKQLILDELIAGRPVVYDGVDNKGTSGHAFNLDGFDGSNSFHVNWGWGGKNNAYFTLENLNDGNFNYVNSHGVLVKIAPAGSITSSSALESRSVNYKIYSNKSGEWLLDSMVDGLYTIYNVYGSVVAEGQFYQGVQTILRDLNAGSSFYVVSLMSGGRREFKKIINSKY